MYQVFTVILLLLLSVGAQAQSFEGTVNYTMRLADFGDDPIPVTMKFKGQKLAMITDMGPMGKMESYVNNETKKVIQVMRAMNMAMEIDMREMEHAEDSMQSSTDKVPVATGNKEKINGLMCEQYTITAEEGTVDLWMTKELPREIGASLLNGTRTMMMGAGGGSNITKKMAELAANNQICVRIVVKQGGNQKALIDYVSYSQSPVSDADLSPPSDIPIQKMDPSTLMGE